MRMYIPGAARAAAMVLKRGTAADHARADAIHAAIQDAARTLYTAIMTGTAAEAHQRYGDVLYIYHTSPRPDIDIQASRFHLDRDGDWTAISHHDITSPADIDLHSCSYLTITTI